MIEALIKQNRSCRRFHEDYEIDTGTLEDLVNLARLSASGGNLQPLKFIFSCNAEKNERIFSYLEWAAYLRDWPGPKAGERPAAYIIILGDTRITRDFGCDHGIAGQSILLGAREKGLAGCMIGAINRKGLRDFLKVGDRFKILLVLAIGKPKEEIMIETVGDDSKIKYWRDNDGIHHVPKRKLDDIILSGY